MASTQIEIALADDDRKRIDRLCSVIERREEMERKHANQASFIKEFHSCLNGIEEIRCIPGAAIDGCWDAKAIREVVNVLVANCSRTWKDEWRGREKENDSENKIADFEGWLRKRYAALVFTYNGSGLGIHKRIADEVKEILEQLHEAKATS